MVDFVVMNAALVNTFSVTMFFILSMVLYFVNIPTKTEYTNYKKARRIIGFALLMIVVIEILRFLFPVTGLKRFLELVSLIVFSFVFTSLSFVSFLYMLEVPRKERQIIKKNATICAVLLLCLGITGYIFVDIRSLIKAIMSTIYIVMCLYEFTQCIREYDRLTMSLEDCTAESLNVKWMYPMLWVAAICSLLLGCSFFYKPLTEISGLFFAATYAVLTFKIINFAPNDLNEVRNRLNARAAGKTATEDKSEQAQITAPVQSESIAHETADDDSAHENKGYSKIEPLVKKWVDEELYTAPEINIKEAAIQMGTNSNYLSQYINRELNTTFSTWLNTLRIEKSKEYLGAGSRMSIEEIGTKVGYQNIYNFSRWFKIVTGMSPSEWRKAQ